MRPSRFLLLLFAWGLPALSHAQWAVTSWVSTPIDDHLVVELPYVTEPELDKKEPGLRLFSTETESLVLMVSSYDMRYSPKHSPDALVTVESLNKFFNRLLRSQVKALKGLDARLLSQGNVVFARSPARAVRFSYTDEVRQQPAYLDYIYVWRGESIYLLACAYRLPETTATIEDRRRFLKSVVFDETQPVKEL